MDEILTSALEQLISNGPFGVLVAIMVYRDFKRDKRLDYVTDELIQVGKDTKIALVEVMTYLRSWK